MSYNPSKSIILNVYYYSIQVTNPSKMKTFSLSLTASVNAYGTGIITY